MKHNSKLERFYKFFEIYGTERLNGLDESYFDELDGNEKQEAWTFLENGFTQSTERINGLYLLDKSRAVELFKQALTEAEHDSPYPEVRRESESSRLLMIRYINLIEPDEKYVNAMAEFAKSEFEDIRIQFARSLPTHEITPDAIEALKGMIYTEAETIPLSSAIIKFMEIHGMDFDSRDPLYKKIYSALSSSDPAKKKSAMDRLETA
jgi:hypothetical protein